MELAGTRTIAAPAVIDSESAAALTAAVTASLADDTVMVIVLEGTAGEFCRGMDIALVGSPAVPADRGEDGGEIERSIDVFARGLCLLAQAAKPTLAVVRGAALGGGLGLAAACDIVVSTRSATFGLPEGLLGLTPAVIAPALLERISAQQFKRLALLAEPVGADEARSLGLADEVVDDDALERRVRRLCTALMRVQPGTKSGLAQVVAHSRAETMDAAMRWGVAETARAARSTDVKDRIARFLDGEAPWQKP